MAAELKVPSVGESITEVQVGRWLKSEGDFANRDEAVVEIESEKATVEVLAPISGIISEIICEEGSTASVGEIIGQMEEAEAPSGGGGERKRPPQEDQPAPKEVPEKAPRAQETTATAAKAPPEAPSPEEEQRVMPAAQRALAEKGLRAEEVEATGPGGRLLKEDVMRHKPSKETPQVRAVEPPAGSVYGASREEDIVPLSPMRRTIAQHLVRAQQNAALLTTFNEVDMSSVMRLRKEYRDTFEKKYGTRLGFMSFFVKASIEALKMIPEINAEIRENNIIYRNYYDVGIAIGSGKGLVVPILRNAETMSFAQVEVAINDFAARAKENKLSMDDLRGGTFTITNGGVYGSLLSTPIVNPPQSGILGMHAIQERPVAENGEVVVRPMMYIALTYDHRIVDGRGAVTFLKRVKECVENPTRILLEI